MPEPPPAAVPSWTMPPVVPLKFVRPAALPLLPTAHVTPSSADFCCVSSTMIASTATCSLGMSICLITANMSWRMRSGALITSAFVPASAQIETGPVAAFSAARARRGRLAPRAARPSGRAELGLELAREVHRVRVVQILDQRVAALRGRRIEMRDQRACIAGATRSRRSIARYSCACPQSPVPAACRPPPARPGSASSAYGRPRRPTRCRAR